MTEGRQRIPLLFLLAGAGFLLSLWLLRKALAPFYLAMVLSYLMAPAVSLLARRARRGLAVLFVLITAFGGVALLIWQAAPRLVTQIQRLVDSIPRWKTAFEVRWGPWFESHPWVVAKLRGAAEGIDPMLFLHGIKGASADLLAGLLQVMTLLLVPVIVYYLLLEGPRFLQVADDLVPVRYRSRVRKMAGEVHERLGGYIRGQLAVTLCMSLLQGLALQILGVPYAWLLGLVAGISNVVPYSPYVTALAPTLLIAGLDGASWGRLLLIMLVFTGVQKIEALYLTPVWVGRASKLHPLEVLLGILSFGFAFGIIGLVFAMPFMIVVKVVLQAFLSDYKSHTWFKAGDEHESMGSSD